MVAHVYAGALGVPQKRTPGSPGYRLSKVPGYPGAHAIADNPDPIDLERDLVPGRHPAVQLQPAAAGQRPRREHVARPERLPVRRVGHHRARVVGGPAVVPAHHTAPFTRTRPARRGQRPRTSSAVTTVAPSAVANVLALTMPPRAPRRASSHRTSRALQSLSTQKPPIAAQPAAAVQSRTGYATTAASSSSKSR